MLLYFLNLNDQDIPLLFTTKRRVSPPHAPVEVPRPWIPPSPPPFLRPARGKGIAPIYKPWTSVIYKGNNHNPRNWGLKRSPWLFNHVSKSWDDPPSIPGSPVADQTACPLVGSIGNLCDPWIIPARPATNCLVDWTSQGYDIPLYLYWF